MSSVTELSVDVDAAQALPNESVTALAPKLGMMVPEAALVTLADNVKVKLSEVVADHVTPVAVPPFVSGVPTSVAGAVVTALLKTAVNNTGPELTGSA